MIKSSTLRCTITKQWLQQSLMSTYFYYEFYFHEFRAWMSFDETLKHSYLSFPEGQINMYIKWLQKVLNRC